MKKLILSIGIFALLSSCQTAGNVVKAVVAPVALTVGLPVGLVATGILSPIIEHQTKTVDNSIEYGNDHFEYTNTRIAQKDGTIIVSGTLKNYKKLHEDVTLAIPCEDKDHNKIGDAIATTKTLKENEHWNFNATLKSNDVRFCYPEKSVITTKEGKNSDTPDTETTSPQK